MIITEVKLWEDCGFTESSLTIPAVGNTTLPAPDLVIENLNPSKNRLFGELQVAEDYVALINMSYLKVTYDFNNATSTSVFYGWVDSIECKSDTDGYPMTVIKWHVDLWRTYKAQAIFKEGFVRRRPSSNSDPPQSYPFRYKTASVVGSLVKPQLLNGSDMWWLIFTFTTQDSQGAVTYTRIGAFPFTKENTMQYIRSNTGTAIGNFCPTFQSIIEGSWDESIRIDPTTIKSAFISPIAPMVARADSDGTIFFPNDDAGISMWDAVQLDPEYGEVGSNPIFILNYIPTDYEDYPFEERSESITSSKTDDVDSYVITGFDGEAIGAIPWGMSINDYTYRLVVSTTSTYIQIRCDGIKSHSEGLCFTIPCISVETTENSWTSYVYSGQRQYDIDSRNQQSINSFLGGLTGSFSQGAMMKGFGAGLEGGMGAGLTGGSLGLAGAGGMLGFGAATAGFAALGGGIGLGVEMGILNPMQQEIEDRGHAMQSDGLLLPGAGFDALFHGQNISLFKLSIDSYSEDIRDNDIALYGAHVSEATSDCTSLINAGGGLQIVNLTVRGDIPVAAKNYIQRLFNNGVRLV